MNKEVNFELAKLLKEKEIYIPAFHYYENEVLKEPYLENGSSTDTEFRVELSDLKEYFNEWSKKISAPTIAEVVMWLYEKHGIWIESTMGKDHTGVWFDWDIFSTITPRKDDVFGEEGVEYEDSPNEKWLNYDTTYSSMIDEHFATMDKKSCSSPAEAYEAAIEYTLKNLL